MTPTDLAPVTLMFEMRERLVRIETKMDGATEKVDSMSDKVDSHDTRLNALEGNHAQLQTQLAMLKWAGGGLLGFVGLFGDRIVGLLFN
jgi:chromosome segregation ATPase